MTIEFKFTTMTLFAAMLVCVIVGLLIMLALKFVWDFICCREKPYTSYDDDFDEEVEKVEDRPPIRENKAV